MTPTDGNTYLVFATVLESVNLGATVTTRLSVHWVTATTKRAAASGCTTALKTTLGFSCFGVKIDRVVSQDQWGLAYFNKIDVAEG